MAQGEREFGSALLCYLLFLFAAVMPRRLLVRSDLPREVRIGGCPGYFLVRLRYLKPIPAHKNDP